GVLRSDGKDNLINAFEMASAVDSCGEPMVREVCVCFGSKLFRGNRITKFSAENFTAFISANFPAVAKVGVHVKWTLSDYRCLCAKKQALIVHSHLETQVIIIKVYPGMTPKVLNAMLHIENLKGVVLETYGSGNAPTSDAFIAELEDAIKRGIPILNVTQCADGSVEMGKYAASSRLREIGVVSGKDITTESAVTKMMYLLGLDLSFSEVCKLLSSSLRGEMTS
ncbi:MAG: asparaginase domain-containing protein, partial [Bacteroidales bacterium]